MLKIDSLLGRFHHFLKRMSKIKPRFGGIYIPARMSTSKQEHCGATMSQKCYKAQCPTCRTQRELSHHGKKTVLSYVESQKFVR